MNDRGLSLPPIQYSVVVPLFNEEKSLRPLQVRLHSVMERLSAGYEIIYVDDGSKDASFEVLKALKEEYPKIQIISFKDNKGQSAALFAGFKASSGKWIFTIDADCQNPPEEFFTLLKFKDNFDFITGIRKDRKDSFLKKASALIARFFRRLVLRDTTVDIGCSLKLFKREVINSLPTFKNFHRFFTFLARVKGFKVKEVYVNHKPRIYGKSKYGYIKRGYEGIIGLWNALRYASF